MPHIATHALTALPFLIIGDYPNAIGCVAPDVAWIGNEITIRKSKKPASEVIETLSEWRITPYRITHSILLWILFGWANMWLGVGLHILLDCFTHTGRMTQQPFYPFLWRWRWTL